MKTSVKFENFTPPANLRAYITQSIDRLLKNIEVSDEVHTELILTDAYSSSMHPSLRGYECQIHCDGADRPFRISEKSNRPHIAVRGSLIRTERFLRNLPKLAP